MKKQGRYHHIDVDWLGESITLCGVAGGDAGTGFPILTTITGSIPWEGSASHARR